MSANLESLSDLKKRSTTTSRCRTPKRYCLAIITSLALFVIHFMRKNVAVSFYAHNIKKHYSEADVWSSYSTLYSIHSAFSWSFIAAQIPGALLTVRFSPHRVLFYSMLLTALCHITLTVSLYRNYTCVMIIQILQGIAEGPIYPSCIAVMRSWSPLAEKTRLYGIVLCGSIFGLVAGIHLNIEMALELGKMAHILILSVCALLWCLAWITQTYENPSSDPNISHYELMYLEENTDPDIKIEIKLRSLPLLAMLKSLPLWSICIVNFCFSFTEYIINVSPHFYYRAELENKEYNMFFDNILPSVIGGVMVLSSGFVADCLINRTHLSITLIRKLFCSGAFTVCGILFLIVRYHRNVVSTIICFNLAQGFLGLAQISFLVNCLDLSPCYASLLVGIAETLGHVSTIIAPLVLSSVLNSDLVGWTGIFDAIVSMSFVVAILYGVFGSGNVQWWGKPDSTRTQNNENEQTATYYPYQEEEESGQLVEESLSVPVEELNDLE